MSTKRFPYIPPDLLRELEKRFPEQSPEIGETHEALMWRGGQRSVIRFLTFEAADQSKNQLHGDP